MSVTADFVAKTAAPPALQTLLARAQRIHAQQRTTSPKLYSVHAPEVECIAKGKAHKKYELGCKVAVSSTTHMVFLSNFCVAVKTGIFTK